MTLSIQQIKEIVEKSGFQWSYTYGVLPRGNPNMKWWHYQAMCFSEFLARKKGLICFRELPLEDNGYGKMRADCFIIPVGSSGIVIQWEKKYSKKKSDFYDIVFENVHEVLTLSYNKMLKESRTKKYEEFIDDWMANHQLG